MGSYIGGKKRAVEMWACQELFFDTALRTAITKALKYGFSIPSTASKLEGN